MNYRSALRSLFFARPSRRALVLAAGAALALGSCRNESEVMPDYGNYYPIKVGSYRIFAVTDSSWANFKAQPPVSFQFRETITDQFTDAAGNTAYRLVRARRATPNDAWVDDSVMVLTPLAQALTLTRNNRRTVELIYPVKTPQDGAGQGWNRNAFNAANGQDTINRRYVRVRQALRLTPAGGQPKEYTETVTTYDEDENDLYYLRTYEQTFAPGVGPVLRRRRRFFYCDAGNPACVPTPTAIFQGSIRRETLLEQGE